MKKGIHPLRKKIGVIATDGSFLKTIAVSTYSTDVLKLDIDHKKHSCWNTHLETKNIDTGDRLHRFKTKYA